MSKTPAVYDFAAIRDAAQNGDPALFAAESRCGELQDQIAAVSRTHEPMTIEVEEREIEPLDDARVAAERVVFNTMPETLAGAAVKLRLLAHPDRGIDATEEEITALRQVLAFVEASAAAAPVTASEQRTMRGAGEALEELIAEERAAWRREIETDEAQAAANALTDRVVNWIPDNLADAIQLLEFDTDGLEEPQIAKSVLAGLRIIASAADPVAAEPVTGDRRILGLFREWLEAWRYSGSIAATATDDQMGEAVATAARFEDAIAETPAEGIAGLAVKVFFLYRDGHTTVPKGKRDFEGGDPCELNPPTGDTDCLSPEMSVSAIRDVSRLVPALTRLCAPALAEEPQP